MPDRTPTHPLAWIILLGVSIFTTLCLTGWIQGLDNTFHANGRWITSKTFLERGAIGGTMFRVTRVPLARNRVDLGSWFGFHEIIWHEPLDLASLDFEFELDDGAWVAVLFDGANHAYDAVRLSRDPTLPSIECGVDRKRLFTRSSRIDAADWSIGSGWHHGRVVFGDEWYELLVDGVLVDSGSRTRAGPQSIGFKGGGASTRIDEVRMSGRDGTDVYENFRNDRGAWRTASWVALGLAILHGFVWFGVARLGRRFRRPSIVYHLAVATVTSVGAALGFVGDHYFFASRYPREVLVNPEYPNTIVFEPSDPIPPSPSAGELETFPITFVGSSQTWGSGATLASDTWVRLVEQRLNAIPDRRYRFVCQNTGINGATSDTLLPRYLDEWLPQGPRMTVIDLSHNDQDLTRLGLNLCRFTEANRAAGVETVFVLEPNTHQPNTWRRTAPNVPVNHTLIRRLGQEIGVPVIDMQAKMDADRNRGFLWWDFVHLTSGGQQVFAENLAEELVPLLTR
ncbi:MAG: SGNH/GDSL hydrolase family protein [Planctomycetes bacterium]|nr:SGNH/GDSL hydrolase family protein [Planctomycetota bacterium]